MNFKSIEEIITFIVMISILIVLHEAGHFIVARWNGIHVEAFAIGLGPSLLHWISPRSNTSYHLKLLPLGGYCRMQTNMSDTKETEDSQEQTIPSAQDARDKNKDFESKNGWQRLSVILAGVTMNFLTAYFVLVAGNTIFGTIDEKNPTLTTVAMVDENSRASKAGLEQGDKIRVINDSKFTDNDGEKLMHGIAGMRQGVLDVTYLRNDVLHKTEIGMPTGKSDIVGVLLAANITHPPLLRSIQEGSKEFSTMVYEQSVGLVGLIPHYSHEKNSQKSYAQLIGPIGIAKEAMLCQQLGPAVYLNFTAQVAIGLAFMNLLPIPIFDGGRACFIIVEMLRSGKRIKKSIEVWIMGVTAIVIAIETLFVMFNDIMKTHNQ